MADSITTQVISDTAGVKYVVKRTNHSDGTGETDSVLVDPTTSNFMTADGTKTIGKVWYSINTANSKSAVELARCNWKHNYSNIEWKRLFRF